MNRLLSTALLLLAAPVAAQGLLITPEPGQTGPQPAPTTGPQRLRPGVHIVRTKVQAEIVDGVATTMIDQVLRNEGSRDAEGTWFMPLPNGAVADHFTMTVGGKEITGEVLDAGKARSVYESIVRRRRDPGLLEYAGEGMLRARIFPIPAKGEVGVTVRLRQVLQPTGGMYEWNWPLRVARLGDAKCGPIGLEVRIKSQTALSTIVTPHTGADIRRDGDHNATVSLEGANGDFEDLRVLYGLTQQEFGLHMLPFRQAGQPGYFTMLLSPPRTLAEAKVPPRCVQFVVDTSGSMKGDKIRQAKASLHTFLNSLRKEDCFQIITFASAVQPLFAQPRMATPENIKQALAGVDALEAMGGTNIGDALQHALSAVPPGDDGATYLPQIIFVTDGQPTVGLTNPKNILELTKQSDKAKARVFALGVGDKIDVRLIDDLVAQHRGARDFVGNREKIEAKVDALCQKISRPALTDVEVSCGELDAFHVHPTRTRDLFCGEMMQVVGRYRDHGMRTIRVTGTQNGVAKEFVFECDFPKATAKYAFVQTLWARQHCAGLLDAIRRNGQQPELITEVRQLATKYGIVTPYTSQLILEEGMRLSDGRTPRRNVRYRGPSDVPASGAGGGVSQGGPSSPSPSGPATGGPASPAGSPSGQPATRTPSGGGSYHGPPGELARLGRARTGQEAIAESKAVSGADDFYLGSSARNEASKKAATRSKDRSRQLLRRANGRVFVVVGNDLVEQGLPKEWRKQVVVVEAFSKDYFALLAQKPQLRKVFALGDRIVFRDGKRIVHVKPAAKLDGVKPGKRPVDNKVDGKK